eukprot:CAMPEP_0198326816 /NCGR_PEP_ID=MMETSP1450-20131203/14242_1 /TAXON_ID=753684 ORGANISM="Madagascaria erythrocladiodes, Strain CCMP3234" /NCGR_SAMPLE_ID=MMETSP1450 /ASSEMBLY_ACC=CAM_ASM_001115 /LENGTH=392 /DNA_ID=CAMNT_0044030815 /DNA_START=188 /DNA_END=1367 /DNA_ORIENTATION=+
MDVHGLFHCPRDEKADREAASGPVDDRQGGLDNDLERHLENARVLDTVITYTSETHTDHPPDPGMKPTEIPATSTVFTPVNMTEEPNTPKQQPLSPTHRHPTPEPTQPSQPSQRTTRGALGSNRSSLTPVQEQNLTSPVSPFRRRIRADLRTPSEIGPFLLADDRKRSSDLDNLTSPISHRTPLENPSRAPMQQDRMGLSTAVEMPRDITTVQLDSSPRVLEDTQRTTKRIKSTSPIPAAESSANQSETPHVVFDKERDFWLTSAYSKKFRRYLDRADSSQGGRQRSSAVYDKWKNKEKPNGRCVGFCHDQRSGRRSESGRSKRFCATVSSTDVARCHYGWEALEVVELSLVKGDLKVSETPMGQERGVVARAKNRNMLPLTQEKGSGASVS